MASTVPKVLTAGDTALAYRILGDASSKPPLILLQSFRATMNHWDSEFLDFLSANRPLILLDYSGVGKSSGPVRNNCLSSARDVISLIQALKLSSVDILGFSIGGFIAQMVTLDAPHLIRNVILVGTGPSVGEGLESGPPELFADFVNASTLEENKIIYLRAFFSSDPLKQAEGEKWWARIHPLSPNYTATGSDLYLDAEGTKMQVEAIVKWVSGAATDGIRVPDQEQSYNRLEAIKCPVLVIAGKDDQVVPVANSLVLWKKMKQARLLVFEGVGHGILFSFKKECATSIQLFLDP